MSIYDVDYSEVFKQLLPPDKREPENLAWGESLVKPIQWNHDNFFTEFLGGSTALDYDTGTSYAVFQEVRYNNQIYQCIKESTGNAPTNTTYWVLVNKDFRGARQRVKYNGQKLVLEYILNKWFGTTFIAQPKTTGPLSVFRVVNVITSSGFFVKQSSPNTSFAFSYSEIQENFVPETSSVNTTNFKIQYPNWVTANQIIQMKAIVEKFKLYGTTVAYESYIP